jgi:hypothetical protein
MAYTTYDLITDVIDNYEGGKSASGTGLELRTTILAVAQRTANKIWYRTQWPFKIKSGSVSLTSGIGDLPADFHAVGPNGSVYRAAYQPMVQRPLQEIKKLQLTYAQQGESEIYSPGDTYNSSSARKRRFLCYPLETATIYMTYERLSPVLVDETPVATDGLLEWPIEFYDVIYEGIVWRRMRSTGNSQHPDQKQIFMEALKDQMIAHSQGREREHYVQPFRGRNL